MRKLVIYPDPRLREPCALYEKEELDQQVFDEMVAAMYHYDGLALAASQVGIQKRAIVIDTMSGPLVMVNPTIMNSAMVTEREREGCLSFPGIFVHVERPAWADVSWRDRHTFEVKTRRFDGILARACFHEIEHLDGKLLIDHANGSLMRGFIEKKMALWHRRNKT